MISSLCLSMIFSENRFPLFRIMLQRAIMCCGSQVASNGNAISITSRTISVATNGITPLKIVVNENVLDDALDDENIHPDRRMGGLESKGHHDDHAEPDRIEAEMG